MNASTVVIVGSATAHGVFSSSTYPQGTISFTGSQQFNQVRLWIPPQTYPSTHFFIDNVLITT
jgi:hypothetical protein